MVMEACVDKKSTLCDLAKEMKVYPQVLRNVRVADKKTARENPKVVEAVEAAGKALGDSAVQRKEIKVYPNDPCPCGSGKKYKQCCGRKTANV